MISSFGHYSSRMFIRGKPVRLGDKIWGVAWKSRYIYSLKVYCGKCNKSRKFGVGRNVVMNFVQQINDLRDVELYFDNFFSSCSLFREIKPLNGCATGAV